MSLGVSCFFIAIAAGAFFGGVLVLIKRLRPSNTEFTNTGAPEGDDRHFRKY